MTQISEYVNIEDNPNYWAALFDFGRTLYEKGEDIRERWKANYQAYLTSDAWKKKAEVAKLAAGFRCQVCNDSESIQVHHRTYEKIGDESPSDLIVLCDGCHSLFHASKKVTAAAGLCTELIRYRQAIGES